MSKLQVKFKGGEAPGNSNRQINAQAVCFEIVNSYGEPFGMLRYCCKTKIETHTVDVKH